MRETHTETKGDERQEIEEGIDSLEPIDDALPFHFFYLQHPRLIPIISLSSTSIEKH